MGDAYLGEGKVPWQDICDAIKEIDYDGWLIFDEPGKVIKYAVTPY